MVRAWVVEFPYDGSNSPCFPRVLYLFFGVAELWNLPLFTPFFVPFLMFDSGSFDKFKLE